MLPEDIDFLVTSWDVFDDVFMDQLVVQVIKLVLPLVTIHKVVFNVIVGFVTNPDGLSDPSGIPGVVSR